jgi:hypothetical protein
MIREKSYILHLRALKEIVFGTLNFVVMLSVIWFAFIVILTGIVRAEDSSGWATDHFRGATKMIHRNHFRDDKKIVGCPALPSELRGALEDARSFGVVRIGSVCGGKHAHGSYHYRGQAVDFRMLSGVSAAVTHFRSWRGGMKHYGGGLIHLDTGPHRRW